MTFKEVAQCHLDNAVRDLQDYLEPDEATGNYYEYGARKSAEFAASWAFALNHELREIEDDDEV